MPINTTTKRASLLDLVMPPGPLDQGDKQTLLGLYAGILAAGPSALAATHEIAGIFASLHPVNAVFGAVRGLAGTFVAVHRRSGVF